MAAVDLTGKLALVTGSSRGLGRQYALSLARSGADVVVHDVDSSAAAEFGEAESGPAVADEIRALGRKSAFLAADLTDPAQAEAMVVQAVEELGYLDILVNNAGGDIGANTPRPEPNDGLEISPDDMRAVVERNLLTTMFACKYAGLHMRDRRSGKIVNVGSIAGHAAARRGIVYAAAKAAISHYTRCLAEELRPYDVNVNCLSPSSTHSGRFDATRNVPNEDDRSRLQRIGRPEDLAELVLFLVGPQSDYLSGETIVCWR